MKKINDLEESTELPKMPSIVPLGVFPKLEF